MLIKELVKLDTQGKFISAVQLNGYEKAQDNLGLVKSYIFAESAPDSHGKESRSVGSIDLLRDIRLAFDNSSNNCFLVTANYGHGKSHLALVLANYFAKQYKSDEVKEILGRIDQTLQNKRDKAEDFHEFKRQHDRFLVIRLSGDTNRSLREQFFPALKKALQEHPSTRDVELPFWHGQALAWLKSKVDDRQTREFLKEFNNDIHNLIEEVEENRQGAYEQYVKLFAHLNNGVPPNPTGNFDLNEAVKWAIENHCGEGKPIAGLLVLFDEFSQFVRSYSQTKTVADFQNLLHGIQSHKGKALFIAFAQHDPITIAEQVAGGNSLEEIKRELNRIERKYELYSLMESVMSAYMSQSEHEWERFLQENPKVRGTIFSQAGEFVWELYSKRYDKELRWNNDKFRQVVVKGCFPLHPLTTALLAHLKMAQGMDSDARTMLRFVNNEFEHRQNQSVMLDGKVNWILPITLADYFGPQIAKQQDYSAYEQAISSLEEAFGEDVTQVQYDVLKALLIQAADDNHMSGDKQIELISHMTGLDYGSTLKTLKDLGKNSVIKYDENTRFNCFWPTSIKPRELENKIKDLISNKKFGAEDLILLNDKMGDFVSGAEQIEVNIPWGTPTDWAAKNVIITQDKFTPEYLRELMKPIKLSFRGLDEGLHGLVLWALALDENELQYFHANAAQVVQDAFPGDSPPPVLVILPTVVHKNLANQFQRYLALEQISKNKDILKEVGQTSYDVENEKTKKAVVKELGNMLGDVLFASINRRLDTLVVPQPYRAAINALTHHSTQGVLKRLYELSYPNRPLDFFTDLNANPKKGASPLREAVKTVSRNLLFNRVPMLMEAGATPVAQRLCKDYLIMKWGLLSTKYYIQEPENVLSLKRAWDYLEQQIQPDEKEVQVKKFLPALLNPPFGFDYNTSVLLFTAWIGKHNKELVFSINNKRSTINALDAMFDKVTPQEILGKICVTEPLALARRDTNKELEQGKFLIEKVHKVVPFSLTDADSAMTVLRGIVSQEICPENEKIEFNDAIEKIKSAKQLAENYDQSAKKLLVAIAGEISVNRLLELKSDVQRLTWDELVKPSQPANTEISDNLQKQLIKTVASSCSQVEKLSRIEGADAERNRLKEQKEALQRKGYQDLAEQLSQAELKLNERLKQLKASAEEAARINQINSMTSGAVLVRLIEYQKILNEMDSGSDGFNQQKTRKLTDIQNSIQQLQKFAENISIAVAQVTQEQVSSLHDQIVSKENRYVGSHYEDALTPSKKVLARLRSFYNEMTALENRARSFRTVDDELEIKTSLEQIGAKYQGDLGQNQNDFLTQIRNNLDVRSKELLKKTEGRIGELERELESPSPSLKDFRGKLNQVGGFITPALAERVDQLRTKLDQKEAEHRATVAEKEQQEKATRLKKAEEDALLNQINSMKLTTGLATLYKFEEELLAIPNSSAMIGKARDQKLSDIRREISTLQSLPAKTLKESQNASLEQARNLQRDLSGKAWRFEETELEEEVSAAKQNLDNLLEFYDELSIVEKMPVTMLEDAREIESKLKEISAKYKGKIGEGLSKRVIEIKNDLEHKQWVAYQQTEKWISALEADLNIANLSELKNRVNQLPTYLSPELLPRIEHVKKSISERQEQYEAHVLEEKALSVIEKIETLFLSLPDDQKRQECLGLLQQKISQNN
jgi:hypothetical protein